MTATNRVDVAVLDTGVYTMAEYESDGYTPITSPENYHQEFDEDNLAIDLGIDVVHSVNNNEIEPLVNESNPYGDDNGHGTHVSAIIAANAKTAKTPSKPPYGIAGVSQNARVIPVKVLDSSGVGDTADFVVAYEYLKNAKQSGKLPNLRVVNMSLSLMFSDSDDADSGDEDEVATGDTPEDEVDIIEDDSNTVDDTQLQSKIEEAERMGIVTVCAAGNEGSSERTFPGDLDACVSVTALDRDGRDAGYSNINEFKDISAPGTEIFSAWGSQADAYASLTGTSQATAIVSGVFSMLFAEKPELTVAEAKQAIYNTARAVEPSPIEPASLQATSAGAASGGNGSLAAASLTTTSVVNGSHGAIDAAAALEYAVTHEKSVGDGDDDGKGGEGGEGGDDGKGSEGGNSNTNTGGNTNVNPGGNPIVGPGSNTGVTIHTLYLGVSGLSPRSEAPFTMAMGLRSGPVAAAAR